MDDAKFSISMPRGDIKKVRFTVLTNDSQIVETDFDDIYFTVKKHFLDPNFLFQKRLSNGDIIKLDNSDYQFTIEPNDTDNLKFDTYDCDIEIVSLADELKQTFTGVFEVTSEATHARNEG